MRRQWIRLYTEVPHKAKVQLLSDKLFRFWINCLCVAGDTDGELPGVDDLAFTLRASAANCMEMLKKLCSAGLVDDIGSDGFAIHNWSERQYESDVSTPRVKRFRNARRNVSETLSETPPEQNRAEQNRKPPYPPGGKSPAAPAEAKQPSEFEAAVAESAKAIHTQHPALRRDCSAAVIEKCLRAILKRHCSQKTPAEKIQFLAGVREAHRMRSQSEQWTAEGGQFAKGLQNYLAPTMDRYLPTEPTPKVNGKVKRWEDYTPEERGNLPGHMNPNLWTD